LLNGEVKNGPEVCPLSNSIAMAVETFLMLLEADKLFLQIRLETSPINPTLKTEQTRTQIARGNTPEEKTSTQEN